MADRAGNPPPTLPPLSTIVVVEVSREGGFAHVPGLAQPRCYWLNECSAATRQRVVEAVGMAAGLAGQVAGGDQRYFRVALKQAPGGGTDKGSGDADALVEACRFDVPETRAPQALLALWRGEEA